MRSMIKIAVLFIGMAFSLFGGAYAYDASPQVSKGGESWYFEQLQKTHDVKYDVISVSYNQNKLNAFCIKRGGVDLYQASKALAKHDRLKKPLIAVNLANMLNTGVKARYCYRNI